MLASTEQGEIVVLGAGVIGLTIAILLQALGFRVRIIAKAFSEDPDDTYTSIAAGAHFRTYADKFMTQLQDWETKTFRMLLQLVRRKEAGIHMLPGLETWPARPADWEDPWYSTLVADYTIIPEKDLPAGQGFGVRYQTVDINVPKYLNYLLTSFKEAGGITEKREVKHINELFTPGVDVVFNCVGNGARTLGGVQDANCYPTRGHTVIVRSPVMYTITTARPHDSTEFAYIIPRGDGTVVLGGTYEPHKSSFHPDPATTQRIIDRCVALEPKLRGEDGKVDVVRAKVGLRPTRVGNARCELEKVDLGDGRTANIIHNYGHGGYGYQSSYGAALAAMELLRRIKGERVAAVVRSNVFPTVQD